ncbi:LOW QUALITY PROTEIN: multiple PDZ domain protein-like [Uloborus diversus]|uniref:LOW QUALITY PROTEIN: multiple PDZ domain protein-like n=1 Tax=Uloborus diversus TaxID=327109 RepID=UPI0024092B5C|nr:LOW QUALITY PROTEIN: multiple PDZ domain protein-like [Uloborus diversus]
MECMTSSISDNELEKIQKKYGDMKGELILVDMVKGSNKLGLSLAGNKDRTKMSVFVCGMHPNGMAYKDGRIRIGDELLEVNGVVVYGRCHLNASAMIKGLSGTAYKILLLRRDGAVDEMAVKPLNQFPSELDEEATEDKYCHYRGMRTVTVRKGTHGLGIMIIEGKHAEVGQGIFISDIQENSVAEQAGLSVGDMILAANDTDLVGADYDTAASILKQAEGLITLIVANPNKPSPGYIYDDAKKNSELIEKSNEKNITIKACERKKEKKDIEPLLDPKKCDIKPGKETTIEITKERMGLGLSIVGGSDTPLGVVLIHEVYPDGAAALDGRLRPGDQILEVNGEDLRNAIHERAIAALRQTPAVVQMLVYREESHHEEDAFEALEVELHKKPGRGLGLSIVGRKNGPGVFISEVVKGGIAEADGRLIQGDQILEVNGQDLKSASQEHAAAVLKTTMGRIHMKIGRLKAGSRRSTSSLSTAPKIQDNIDTPAEPKTIVLERRGSSGLGFSIVGGRGSPHGDLPVYVKRVFDGGAAAKDGRLCRGDQILSVNDTPLEGLTHEQAARLLKEATGTIVLKVLS